MNQSNGFDRELLEIYGELDRDRLMELVVRYARDRLGACVARPASWRV